MNVIKRREIESVGEGLREVERGREMEREREVCVCGGGGGGGGDGGRESEGT